jgi:hypothetical protein
VIARLALVAAAVELEKTDPEAEENSVAQSRVAPY